MRGRGCSICTSARCADVDAALASGGRLVATAQAFGLSKSAVARHRTGCLAPRLNAAARIVAPANQARAEINRARGIAAGAIEPTVADIASLAGLTTRIARALDRLEGAANGAAADSAYTALAALSGQIFRGLETAGRLQGLYADPKLPGDAPAFTININVPVVEERGSRSSVELDCIPAPSRTPAIRLTFADAAATLTRPNSD